MIAANRAGQYGGGNEKSRWSATSGWVQ